MGLLWWGVLATADATTLDELVARGQVSVIESQPDGRLQQVTTYGRIDRPVAEVWAKLTDGSDHTLVRRTTYASAVVDNWLVRQSDDDNHTLELSINAIGPVVEVRGLEAALER